MMILRIDVIQRYQTHETHLQLVVISVREKKTKRNRKKQKFEAEETHHPRTLYKEGMEEKKACGVWNYKQAVRRSIRKERNKKFICISPDVSRKGKRDTTYEQDL